MGLCRGIPLLINGIVNEPPGNTNLTFDCIGFSDDITQGKDQSYANQIYRTYVLVVIHQQLTFMRSENPGFTAKQVVYVDNLGIYNHPGQFEPVSSRIRAIPGVKNVTVASTVPGGILPATYEYTVRNVPCRRLRLATAILKLWESG